MAADLRHEPLHEPVGGAGGQVCDRRHVPEKIGHLLDLRVAGDVAGEAARAGVPHEHAGIPAGHVEGIEAGARRRLEGHVAGGREGGLRVVFEGSRQPALGPRSPAVEQAGDVGVGLVELSRRGVEEEFAVEPFSGNRRHERAAGQDRVPEGGQRVAARQPAGHADDGHAA